METEILTLEEVADYLRVSERTVYDWAQKGQIPGGKLGVAWRFRRKDLDRWIETRLGEHQQSTVGETLSIAKALSADRIVIKENSATKNDILGILLECLATADEIKNRTEFAAAILRRESLMSTGIGLGVAVPHVRLESVSNLVLAVAVSKQGIQGYESLDDEPVQIVVMIAARKDQHTEHIRMLSYLSKRLKDRPTRQQILGAGRPEEIHRILTQESAGADS